MPDLQWADYMAIIAGSIGFITGLLSLFISYRNHVKVSNMNSTMLRIKVKESINILQQKNVQATELMELAEQARKSLWKLTERTNKQANAWKTQIKNDKATLDEVTIKFSDYHRADDAANNEKELESLHVGIHKLIVSLDSNIIKYQDTIDNDTEETQLISTKPVQSQRQKDLA
ncbi:MAG: hypothetical protein HRU20_31510 [Pseudomonadales bacterium]|nr:hypothetical protein [Pseudomonadales bacterium]